MLLIETGKLFMSEDAVIVFNMVVGVVAWKVRATVPSDLRFLEKVI